MSDFRGPDQRQELFRRTERNCGAWILKLIKPDKLAPAMGSFSPKNVDIG